MRRGKSLAIVLLLAALTAKSACADSASTLQPPPLSYFDVLSNGLTKAEDRKNLADAHSGFWGALANFATDKAFEMHVDNLFDGLQNEMRASLKSLPAYGLLYDVGIYGTCDPNNPLCVNQIKLLRGGAPSPIGIGKTPAEAVAAFTRKDHYRADTPPNIRTRLSDSYFMWVTIAPDGKLIAKKLDYPLDQQIWNGGLEINRQLELRAKFYKESPELSQLLGQSEQFSMAAEIAEKELQEEAVKAKIRYLEVSRIAAMRELAEAEKAMVEAERQSESADSLAMLNQLTNIVVVFQKAGATFETNPVPLTDEQRTSAATTLLDQAKARGAVAADARVSVENATRNYVRVNTELVEFYRVTPGFPQNQIPAIPPISEKPKDDKSN